MQKHKVLISLLALGSSIGLAGVFGLSAISNAYAQTNKPDNLIQRLVEKFGLNQTEVDKIVEEFRTEKQKEMASKIEERLSEEVTKGNITEAQKTAIIEKHKEMQTNRDGQEQKNLTPGERKQNMDEKRLELETWAEENGIDMKYVMGFGFGPGHNKGMRNF
ncbi:MAG: hypothetical protein ACD_22C00171G0015 [uncultured bacterium]|nr:MAG: hypothetical protein ACD_22C00171G0015 [uncultured bacterium]